MPLLREHDLAIEHSETPLRLSPRERVGVPLAAIGAAYSSHTGLTTRHVWAVRYDRDLADIFAVQEEITERVVAAIEPELYAAEQVRSQSKPPNSLDVWECVIRALSLIGQGTRDENTEAEALSRRAIAIAPGYARAHSLLAWALLRRTVWSGDLR